MGIHRAAQVGTIYQIVFSVAFYDYVPLRQLLTFHEPGVLCANVTIVMNDTAEDVEKFSVVLASNDYRVEVKKYWVPVYIVDSDGQSFNTTLS